MDKSRQLLWHRSHVGLKLYSCCQTEIIMNLIIMVFRGIAVSDKVFFVMYQRFYWKQCYQNTRHLNNTTMRSAPSEQQKNSPLCSFIKLSLSLPKSIYYWVCLQLWTTNAIKVYNTFSEVHMIYMLTFFFKNGITSNYFFWFLWV